MKKTKAKTKTNLKKTAKPSLKAKSPVKKNKAKMKAKSTSRIQKKSPTKIKKIKSTPQDSLFLNLVSADPAHSPGHRKMGLQEQFNKKSSSTKNRPQNASALNNMSASNVIKRSSFVRTSNK